LRCGSRAWRSAVESDWIFRGRWAGPVTAETRAACNRPRLALREAGFRVEPFRPSTLEALRKIWDKFFLQCGRCFMRRRFEDGRRGSVRSSRSSRVRRSCAGADGAGTAGCVGGIGFAARQDTGGKCAGTRSCCVRCEYSSVQAWRAELGCGGAHGRLHGRVALFAVVQCAGLPGGGCAGGAVA